MINNATIVNDERTGTTPVRSSAWLARALALQYARGYTDYAVPTVSQQELQKQMDYILAPNSRYMQTFRKLADELLRANAKLNHGGE
jgi:hypothetical protein